MFFVLASLGLNLFISTPASPMAAPAASDINAAITRYNLGAIDPLPQLDQAQIKKLQAKKVVSIYREKTAAQHGGSIGLLITRMSRTALWTALRDDRYGAMARLREHRVKFSSSPDDAELLYQYLDLPWPFGARHWLLRAHNNLTLAQSSQNQVWERRWKLAPHGQKIAARWVGKGLIKDIDTNDLKDAIYTPINRGAWFVVELGAGRRLLGFQVSTIAAGAIPDRLVAQYALLRMDEILHELLSRARQTAKSARAGKKCIVGADGQPLQMPACQLARRNIDASKSLPEPQNATQGTVRPDAGLASAKTH